MKVFISVDIEGIAGVSDALEGRPGNLEYEQARRLMTEEASAAVRGAITGGASSVIVADSHAFMKNILADQLDPRARLSGVIAIPNYTMAINTGAGDMNGTIFSMIILIQILVTSSLVWIFAKKP